MRITSSKHILDMIDYLQIKWGQKMVCSHFKNLDAQNIELKNVAEQIYNAENCRSKRGSSSQEKIKSRHFVTIATSEIESKSKGLPHGYNIFQERCIACQQNDELYRITSTESRLCF